MTCITEIIANNRCFKHFVGKVTLWVPGIDHAGIATQSVVEKRLKKEENLTRHDLGREEFVKRVWEWKNTYGNRITEQQRLIGISADWTRTAFTLDDNLCRAVTEAFVRFHEDGLVYRDTRLVNWSCALKSAISDIEVDFVELEGATMLAVPNHVKSKYEFGTITSFAYKIIGDDGKTTEEEIVVATTRLETMLGDTAVAVHPDDPRYTRFHGKFLQHPFVDRKIPIITDGVLVDMNFGTGAVKITPAHDPNDYLSGKRNNLEQIIVLTEDGKIAPNGGIFAGMMRYDARIAMEKKLEELGLYRGKAPNPMRLGICSRSGDIVEPMMTPQWYVNCNSMAQRACDAVRDGSLKLIPDFHEATWFRWLENIRDWCVSRQLWWGHRIPAYFATKKGEENVDKNDPANNERWVVSRDMESAKDKAATLLGVSRDDVELVQDEDVLDTWFSSGLFPFSVFGWPNNTDDFRAFYPTTLLETGGDILFFWVARMVMMGLHLTDMLPFKTVYLHAMVRDKMGRKMSKSLGNVVDPQEVINGCTLQTLLDKIEGGNLPPKEIKKALEAQKLDFPDGIPECGTDALRFGLLAYTAQGRDVNLDIKRVVGYRQFCNKVWNAVKFAVTYLNEFQPSATMHLDIAGNPAASTRDLYILSKLNKTIALCDSSMRNYLFADMTSALHSFFLYDLCDLYLELIKPVVGFGSEGVSADRKRVTQATLYTCLEQFMRLTHPIMPFVTEELWQRLPLRSSMNQLESIMVSAYPDPVAGWTNDEAEKQMEFIKSAVHAARSLRADYKVPNHVQATFYFQTTSDEVRAILESQGDDFCTLSRGSSMTLLANDAPIPRGCCIRVVSDQLSILVDLTGLINLDDEISRLEKDVARLTIQVEQYEKKMGAADYEEKVPENVRVANTEKLQSYVAELEKTNSAIASFRSMQN